MRTKLIIGAAALTLFATQACEKQETLKSNSSVRQSKNSFGNNLKISSAVSDYGVFTIQCVAGGKYIEPVGDLQSGLKLLDATTLMQWQASVNNGQTDRWQKWQIIKQSNGYYKIMNLFSGKNLDVPGNVNTVGKILQQWKDNTTDAQYWAITPVGSNYKIINKGNGLAITNTNGSTSNGTTITQEVYTGANKQLWTLNAMTADSYRDDKVVMYFHRTNPSLHSVAFDQGNSIPLSDGRVLWITEDAWDGVSLTANGDLKCNNFISYRNSVLIQPASKSWDPNLTGNITINNSTSNQPLQVFNIQPGNDWTWPGQGVEMGNKVYVSASEGSGLDGTSNSFYEMTENSGSNVWAVSRRIVAGANNNAAGIVYGTGFAKPGDGYVYCFGTKTVFFNSNELYVGRFPINNFFSWTFWNGSSWVSTPVAGGSAIVTGSQQNVAVGYVNGKYVKMDMDLGWNCDPVNHNIYICTASNPTGPWSAPTNVWTINDMDSRHVIRYYTPAVHPEFNNGKNELLLTYSVNFSPCQVPNECVNGGLPSAYYQIKGVRVPYSKIGL